MSAAFVGRDECDQLIVGKVIKGHTTLVYISISHKPISPESMLINLRFREMFSF